MYMFCSEFRIIRDGQFDLCMFYLQLAILVCELCCFCMRRYLLCVFNLLNNVLYALDVIFWCMFIHVCYLLY
jgi:hypothetical protein